MIFAKYNSLNPQFEKAQISYWNTRVKRYVAGPLVPFYLVERSARPPPEDLG